MITRLIFLSSLLFSFSSYALDKCNESIKPIHVGKDDRFSLIKSANHTDWVLIRFIITSSGSVNDIKPMKFSSDLFINQAQKRVKKISYPPVAEKCYQDLVLYHQIVR